MTSVCARCHHPYPLHGNGKTACKAVGCKAGPDEQPCPGFVRADEAEPVAQAS